jgi:hypothetical protein
MDPTLVIANAVLVIVICAISTSMGFYRPSWARSYTTAARFRGALMVHIFLYLLLLAALYAILRRASHTFAGASTASPSVSTLLWIALALTLCARIVSARPRAWLQRIAGVPDRAQRLAARLTEGELEPAQSIVEQARSTLSSRGVDVDADWLPLAQPAQRLLLKATELFLQLRDWEDNRAFSAFLAEVRNDYDLLRRRYDRLSFRVSRTVASIERLGEVRHLFSQRELESTAEAPAAGKAVDVLVRKIVGDLLSDCCEDIAAFYGDACLLAARAVLTTRSTRRRRDALIAALGFKLSPRAEPIRYGFLASLGVLLYFGVWFFFVMLPRTDTNLPRKELVIVVSLVVFGAIAIAIVPKLRWGFANGGLHARTPIGFVVGAGLCAALFAVLVNLGAGALFLGGWAGALRRLSAGAPWLCATFLTASSMAWLVQDHRWRTTANRFRRRGLDAVTVGFVWVLSFILGHWLLKETQPITMSPAEFLQAAVVCFGFGAVIGFVTPESVRRDYLRATVRSAQTAASNFSLFKAGTSDA